MDIILAIWDMGKYNIAIRFNWYSKDNSEMYEKVKKTDIPFYFYYFIDSWEEIYLFAELGVSDIYITNQLGFNLPLIYKIAQERKIKVRCFPNISQYNWDDQKGYKGFYIRPEDIDLYSAYIDVLEFYNMEDRQNVIYEIYFKDKKWVGDLREIVQGIQIEVPNYYIMDRAFATTRLSCDKKCLYGNNCHICESLLDLAKTIKDSPDY